MARAQTQDDRAFNLRFFGGIAIILLPFLIGVVLVLLGVETIPEWFGISYVVGSLVVMIFGAGVWLSSASK